MKNIKGMVVIAVSLLMLAQVSLAAPKEQAPSDTAKPKYRVITGDVLSVKEHRLVIKSKRQGAVTLATTKKTTTIGAKHVKKGDRAKVRYRHDKNGKTATRINILSSAGKAAP